MEITEVKEFIESNKDSEEVKGLIKTLTPSLDDVMEIPEFQKAIKSFADAEASRQVEAFKSKTLPLTVEEEVKKRMEAAQHKEPWEIKIQEMEKKQNELMTQLKDKERQELIQKNKNLALTKLSEKKLPTDVLDFLVSDEEDKTNKNLEMFSTMMENYTTNLKQGFMSSNNTKVPGKQETNSTSLDVPGDDASQADWEAYYRKKK